jgi:hypothetical protein
MPAVPAFRSAVLALVLAGCTRSYQVVEVPQYGADLYPVSQTRSGVTVAINEIRSPERVQRYFGADLLKERIFPVNVVVSNYSKQRVALKPSDILLYNFKDVMDPVPLEMVVASAKRQHGGVASAAEEPVDKFFHASAFRDTVLSPNESYSGIVYFALPAPQKRSVEDWFRSVSTYGSGLPKIRVGVTGVEGGERMLFGPFGVTLPEE